VLNGVPLDALVGKLASNRNAIYKMLFDARSPRVPRRKSTTRASRRT
jgi:hypothetical protein